MSRLSLFFLLGGVLCAQNPEVRLVVNSASNSWPGLPNGPIAQGAMFTLYGANLGPAQLTVASAFPLGTALGGTSVRVTVGGQSLDAIPYYTSATQLAAILPSRTPVGTGTITVTYQGRTSAPANFQVVQSNPGLYTVSQNGFGDAVATLGDYRVITPVLSANPGETIILWANGLGPVADDETRPARGGDMTNVPLEVFIGGRPARILYRGRSNCCVSLDQINVEIPHDVAGCTTPVQLRVGSFVSNTATLPVASTGRRCTAGSSDLSEEEISRLLSQGSVRIGLIGLSKDVTQRAGSFPPRGDTAAAQFYRQAVSPEALANLFEFPEGTCQVSVFVPGSLPPIAIQSLDAGASLALDGSGGRKTLDRTTVAGRLLYGSQLDPAGAYLRAGQEYVVTGPGGPDVGPFTARVRVHSQLVWTNEDELTQVNRNAGVTVRWRGAESATAVYISGSSGNADGSGALFNCRARPADGSFTVPAHVLLSLPVSPTAPIPLPGGLGVSAVTQAPFRATGLDAGAINFSQGFSKSVPYR